MCRYYKRFVYRRRSFEKRYILGEVYIYIEIPNKREIVTKVEMYRERGERYGSDVGWVK